MSAHDWNFPKKKPETCHFDNSNEFFYNHTATHKNITACLSNLQAGRLMITFSLFQV
jgi:hypothetical protein